MLPDPCDLHAYIDTLLGPEHREELRAVAKSMRPLAECTPIAWARAPRECEDISHDCA